MNNEDVLFRNGYHLEIFTNNLEEFHFPITFLCLKQSWLINIILLLLTYDVISSFYEVNTNELNILNQRYR